MTVTILAVSGSLRAASCNTALLRAAETLAPPGVRLRLYGGIGDLPLFNPDLERDLPAPARHWRASIDDADALLIASPEYAHGVSGAIKNALDWAVGMERFPGKPVALINTAPRASHAQAALREILQTMSACLVEPASITLALAGSGLDAEAIAAHAGLAGPLRAAIEALARSVPAAL